eukprot:5655415-Prymnesium_polylepis.2
MAKAWSSALRCTTMLWRLRSAVSCSMMPGCISLWACERTRAAAESVVSGTQRKLLRHVDAIVCEGKEKTLWGAAPRHAWSTPSL